MPSVAQKMRLGGLVSLCSAATALAFGCDQEPKRPSTSASTSSPHSVPKTTPSASARAAPSASAAAASASAEPEDYYYPGYDAVIGRFQDALRRGDRRAVAALVTQPVRVNLGQCSKYLNAGQLVKHYDKIFTAEMVKRAVSDKPPYAQNWLGARIGQGDIWFAEFDDDPPRAFAINTTLRDIPELPCGDRKIQPMPEWVYGTWEVVSFYGLMPDEEPLRKWRELKKGFVKFEKGQARQEFADYSATCKIDHYAVSTEDEIGMRGTPAAEGLAHGEPRFIATDCGHDQTSKEFWVLSDKRLVTGRGEFRWILLRKQVRPHERRTKVGVGESCTGNDVECSDGLLCEAEGHLKETCVRPGE